MSHKAGLNIHGVELVMYVRSIYVAAVFVEYSVRLLTSYASPASWYRSLTCIVPSMYGFCLVETCSPAVALPR